MFNKVIDIKNLTVINIESERYVFFGQKLWQQEKYIGSGKTLPRMNSQERLILQYNPSTKKNSIVALYTKKNSWTKVKIIPLTLVATTEEQQLPYVIREKEKARELYDANTGDFLGEIFVDETIEEQVVIRTTGHLTGTVFGLIRNIALAQQEQEQPALLDFIEEKLGKTQIPDLREIMKNDAVNGEEVLRTLKNLLTDRSFDEHYLKRLNFKPGEFLQKVTYYLDVLIELDKPAGNWRTALRNDYFQLAITIALYMNLGNIRKKFNNEKEYESYIIAKVLKLKLKAFLKMTKQDNLPPVSLPSQAKNLAKRELYKRPAETPPETLNKSKNKRHNYYWKRNLYVEIPVEYQEKTHAVIAYLSWKKKVVSASPEKLAGVIKFVFNEQRSYVPANSDYYKLIVGLEELLLTRTRKRGVMITHSSLLSFFRTLSHAFNIEHFESANFAAELKKALLLTLIDVNYCQGTMQPGGFLYKYAPQWLSPPAFNSLPIVRLAYHSEVLKLIEADQSVADPFALFLKSKSKSTAREKRI